MSNNALIAFFHVYDQLVLEDWGEEPSEFMRQYPLANDDLRCVTRQAHPLLSEFWSALQPAEYCTPWFRFLGVREGTFDQEAMNVISELAESDLTPLGFDQNDGGTLVMTTDGSLWVRRWDDAKLVGPVFSSFAGLLIAMTVHMRSGVATGVGGDTAAAFLEAVRKEAPSEFGEASLAAWWKERFRL